MSIKTAWSRRRQAVIARDSRRCTQCGRAAPLDVHHKVAGQSLRRDFKRGELSPVEALQSVCVDCHRQLHHPQDPERVQWAVFVRGL